MGGQGGQPLMLAHAFATWFSRRSCHELQFRGDLATSDSVLGKSAIGLEIEKPAQCLRTEDSVNFPGIKSKGVEAALEFSDVVSSRHRDPSIEEAVAQPKACSYQGAPGVGPNYAVRRQAAGTLERSNGIGGASVEGPELAVSHGEAKGG